MGRAEDGGLIINIEFKTAEQGQMGQSMMSP